MTKIWHEGINENHPELQKIIRKYYIRRKLIDVKEFKHVPSWHVKKISTDKTLLLENEEVYGDLKELISKTQFSHIEPHLLIQDDTLLQQVLSMVPSFEKMTTFRRVQALAKVPAISRLIMKHYARRKNIHCLIGTHHSESAKEYFRIFRRHWPNLPVVYVDGAVKVRERDFIIQELNNMKKGIGVVTMGVLCVKAWISKKCLIIMSPNLNGCPKIYDNLRAALFASTPRKKSTTIIIPAMMVWRHICSTNLQ